MADHTHIPDSNHFQGTQFGSLSLSCETDEVPKRIQGHVLYKVIDYEGSQRPQRPVREDTERAQRIRG